MARVLLGDDDALLRCGLAFNSEKADYRVSTATTVENAIMRRPWDFKGRPIVVGVDGSAESYAALKRAVEIARAFDAQVEAIAVYDPFFHTGVFRAIAGALPEFATGHF